MSHRYPLAFAALALLCWMLSALGGLHVHQAPVAWEHGHHDVHGQSHDLHSEFAVQHAEHHAVAGEVDSGLDTSLLLTGGKLLPDLVFLLSYLLLLLRPPVRSVAITPLRSQRLPRRSGGLRPPLRAPPIPA